VASLSSAIFSIKPQTFVVFCGKTAGWHGVGGGTKVGFSPAGVIVYTTTTAARQMQRRCECLFFCAPITARQLLIIAPNGLSTTVMTLHDFNTVTNAE
jgi:hypothetical protein